MNEMDPEIKPRLLCTCACHRTVCEPECTQCDGSSASCTRDQCTRRALLRRTFDTGAIPELDDALDDPHADPKWVPR